MKYHYFELDILILDVCVCVNVCVHMYVYLIYIHIYLYMYIFLNIIYIFTHTQTVYTNFLIFTLCIAYVCTVYININTHAYRINSLFLLLLAQMPSTGVFSNYFP